MNVFFYMTRQPVGLEGIARIAGQAGLSSTLYPSAVGWPYLTIYFSANDIWSWDPLTGDLLGEGNLEPEGAQRVRTYRPSAVFGVTFHHVQPSDFTRLLKPLMQRHGGVLWYGVNADEEREFDLAAIEAFPACVENSIRYWKP